MTNETESLREQDETNMYDTFIYINENADIVYEHMKILEVKLNHVLAANWWQKYISAAFWSNISTPLNLTIMLLTTLTTGQATTSNLLSSSSFVSVSIASLILSVINTFFRPHSQMNDNLDMMRKWQSLGSLFERVYYSKNNNREDFERRLNEYSKLQKNVHSLQNAPTPTSQNFFTDMIYYFISVVLIKKRRNLWINAENFRSTDRSVQTEPYESSVV